MSKLVKVGTLIPPQDFKTSLTKREGRFVKHKSADAVVVQFEDDDEETQLHSDVLVQIV